MHQHELSYILDLVHSTPIIVSVIHNKVLYRNSQHEMSSFWHSRRLRWREQGSGCQKPHKTSSILVSRIAQSYSSLPTQRIGHTVTRFTDCLPHIATRRASYSLRGRRSRPEDSTCHMHPHALPHFERYCSVQTISSGQHYMPRLACRHSYFLYNNAFLRRANRFHCNWGGDPRICNVKRITNPEKANVLVLKSMHWF